MFGQRPVVQGLSILTFMVALGVAPASFATQQSTSPGPQRSDADLAQEIDNVGQSQKAAAETARKIAGNMRNVERIQIRVPGMATISGEYRMNGDGAIALPGLGRLQVGAGTVQDLET